MGEDASGATRDLGGLGGLPGLEPLRADPRRAIHEDRVTCLICRSAFR